MTEKCMSCPRKCGAKRNTTAGFCGTKNEIMISRAALHFWEEPCLSGTEGSGTVFFSGCNLKCVYCQNHKISRGMTGHTVTTEELAKEFLRLQDAGANNINLVTPSHYYLQIKEALEFLKQKGSLHIPVVANTSSYDSVDVLKSMEGYVDIWLADYKYDTPELAKKYSVAPDYPETAFKAIEEMVRQSGAPTFDGRGMMEKGVIVRILLLPNHVKEAEKCVERIYNVFGDNVIISLLNQYTPVTDLSEYPEINRKVTKREYEKLVDHAISLGVENAFIQEGETAKESFIPDFE